MKGIILQLRSNYSLWIGWGRASLEAWRRTVEDNRRMRCWGLPSVSPYNTVAGPPSSIAIVISCISDDERGRYRGPGVSWGRNGLENHNFLVHIPQLRTKKLLTRYRRTPRGRPQYRRQGERSFRGDVASWGYLSRVVLVASSRKKTGRRAR